MSTLQHLAKDMDTDQPVQFYEKDVEAFMQVGRSVGVRPLACARVWIGVLELARVLPACVRACVRARACACAAQHMKSTPKRPVGSALLLCYK